MSLNQFIAHVKTVGLPTNSRYFLTIPNDDSTMSLLCDSFSMPGASLMTTDIRSTGEVSEIVYGITYPSVTFEFLIDNNFGARKFFEDWLDKVFNRTTRNVGYYNDYVKQVDVTILNKKEEAIYSLRLHQAYPKSVSNLDFSHTGSGLLRCQIEMNYKFWERNVVSVAGEVDSSNSPFNVNRSQLGAGILGTAKAQAGTVPIGKAGTNGTLGVTPDTRLNLLNIGDRMGAEFNRSGNSVSALFISSNLSLPGDTSFGVNFGQLGKSIGQNMGTFGAGLTSLGLNPPTINNSINQMAVGLLETSKNLNATQVLLNKVSIPSNITTVGTNLAELSSKIGASTTTQQAMSHIKSVGANMGATGTELQNIASSIKAKAGAAISPAGPNSVKSLGTLFSIRGSDITNIASNNE